MLNLRLKKKEKKGILLSLINLYALFLIFTDCKFNGQFYSRGEIFDKGDSCNTCKCLFGGTVQCSEKKCFPGI